MSWTFEDLTRARSALRDALAEIPQKHRIYVQMELDEVDRCLADLVTSVGLVVAEDEAHSDL